MSALRLSLRVASDLPAVVPGVWHADTLGMGLHPAQPTGYALLDTQLPGGGWPVGALSEVLQPSAGLHEWQLVLPALAQATAQRAGTVVAVAPPCEPFGPALTAKGLSAQRLCMVRADNAKAALWAAEQALRCRDVLAVMAWLPQAQPAALRRLQLAAAQQQQLLWVFRPASAALQASPALLRLQVQGLALPGDASASPGMQVHILKRRGPHLAQGLDLPACHPQLAQALTAQAERRRAAQMAVHATVMHRNTAVLGDTRELCQRSVPVPAMVGPEGREHALDRTAIAMAG
ncbi:protein ImuA [Acidovorax sp. 69]|uniref:translesion DNA synthesis-associated protein ImuA n=1 Tax=Acidovorax sp. 69 TaxID=2035202 RepID=UPI000C231E4B|nr:translesion DNA synthesis-associated protein ImuA [Acidovorax sp. 69]PJI97777.1 protein ImuA [Acidovorax sp. 69]